jgi:biotin carboxyl carrier protein
MQEQLTSVRTEIESGVTTMLNSLTFIDNNKPLFSDNKQEQFRSIVNDLYGRIPNHFRGGIMYGNSADTADALDTLEDMRTIEVNDLAAGDVEMLGVIVMGQTQALLNLYTSAESTILDRDTVANDSDTYSTYFANRAAIIQALSQLESAQSSLQVKIDDIQATEAETEQSVTTTALDEEMAARQAAFRKEIAVAAAASAQAAQRVVAVERSLGTIVSPFPGVVADTFKEVGEYVSAGEPLLTMVGAGGREVAVSVPVTLVDQVAVGSTFHVAGKAVGVVSRLSPVSSGHSIKIIIRLSDTATQVGTSLSGELTIASAENSFLVPREYVFFNSGTAEVHDADGQIHPAQINYDNGDMFQLTFLSTIPTQPLVPSRSISFK